MESTWELPHDSGAQQVGHDENMQMHGFIVGDAGGEVAAQFIARLGESLVEMFLHGRPHRVAGPEPGVCCGKEVGDVVGVGVSARLGVSECSRITGLRCLENFDSNCDVIVQQRG